MEGLPKKKKKGGSQGGQEGCTFLVDAPWHCMSGHFSVVTFAHQNDCKVTNTEHRESLR